MKNARLKRRGNTSATLAPTLWLVLSCSGLCIVASYGADPAWWHSTGSGGAPPAVMAQQVITKNGAVTTNYAPNPNGLVTQGQLKRFTVRAVDEMNAKLPGGAGPQLNTMVSNWAQDYATNNYNATTNRYAPYKPSDMNAMTVGQLKYVGHAVWSQLVTAGYTNTVPAWLDQNITTDNNLAVVGQLKEIFDFDLPASPPPAPTNLTASTNSNGTINLTWTLPANNTATSYVIEQQNVDGTWTIIGTITAPNATSFTVHNLSAGENPTFEIIARNGPDSSLPTTTPSDPGIIKPSNVTATVSTPGEVDMTWQNNATDATYVQVDESYDGVNWTHIATLPPTATNYSVMNLPAGSFYFGVSCGNN